MPEHFVGLDPAPVLGEIEEPLLLSPKTSELGVLRESLRPGRICLLLAACLAFACGSDEYRTPRHLERGAAYLEDHDFAAAGIEYRNVLQIDPNHAEAHYGLARSLIGAGKAEGASWELRETIRLDPAHVEARLRFGWLALVAQENDEALAQAQALLDLDRENREALHLRVAALLGAGDVERAAAESEAILERWPDEARAHYNLARARTEQKRIEEAEQHLLRYRALEGGSLAATRELVHFYMATNQTAEAESFLRAAVHDSAAADRPELALTLADLLDADERGAEAAEFLQLALDAAPERLDVRVRLATLRARDGWVAEAHVLLEESRAFGAPDSEVALVLGDLLADVGRLDDALRAYRKGLRVAPTSVPLRLREAEVLMGMGELEQSSERILSLLEEDPDNPALELAWIRALALGPRSDEAIEKLRNLVAQDPDLPIAHFLLGVLWLGKDRPAAAVGSLEIAAAGMSGADARVAQRLLAEAYLRSGDHEAAARSAERVFADHPEDLQARLILANAWLASGATQRAESLLDAAEVESAALYAARARVFVRTDRLEQAQAALERARALEPDSVQWVVDLAWVMLERGESNAALQLARSEMLAHPEVPEYANLIGQIQVQQGEEGAAVQAFERTVEIDPGFVLGYLNLARLAEQAGRIQDARDRYGAALAQRPGDAEVLQALGSFEYRHGQIDAAIEAFDAVLRTDPTAATSQADLARALADADRDLPRALELARAARDQDPTNPAYAEALARVLHRSGLHRAAVEQLRDAIDLAPHPIAAYHYRLGVALMDADRSDEAARELKRALDLDASFEGAQDAQRRLETHRPRHSALGPS